MSEPGFSEKPLEQAAAQVGSGGAQGTHGPSSDIHQNSGDEAAAGTGSAHEDAGQDLHVEVTQLRRAMQTRAPIDKSMGVLMAAYGLSEDEAWKILVTVSQNTNTKLYAVAEEIVASTQKYVLDARLRRTIQAALKDLRTQ
ncbi:ANTAR domain-containing protein [Streptomyces abyssalis]|uniref:ANTAR domain-containing protein n=1 Tax=Streptomyces abyssalis TaxID=933944 RepID=UPI00085C8915|nr:ANTAR domain-containing protein [Streptomyces abyssalis]